MNFSTLNDAFEPIDFGVSSKTYSMYDLVNLLRSLRLLDERLRIVGWEHLTYNRPEIMRDLLLLVNRRKSYPHRGSTEELRIPEDISTDLYKKIKKYL